MELFDNSQWGALFAIIGINIVLSGDNAIVIALACRDLPVKERRRAAWLGSFAAIGLRVLLTAGAAGLLSLPFLRLAGGALLTYVAVKLLLPSEGEEGSTGSAMTLAAAVRVIVVADFVMSLDNVLGVAAAARGDLLLMVVGLLISMPVIVFGSGLIMHLTARFPVIVPAGAALLGYVAGEMVVSEPLLTQWIDTSAHWLHDTVPVVLAVVVVAVGRGMARRRPVPHLDVASVPHPAQLHPLANPKSH